MRYPFVNNVFEYLQVSHALETGLECIESG